MKLSKTKARETMLAENEGSVADLGAVVVPCGPTLYAFLSDFNFDNFEGVRLVEARGPGVGWLEIQPGDVLEFVEVMRREPILLTEYGMVRRLLDDIEGLSSGRIAGVTPKHNELVGWKV